jgi:tetratricopeptide (TPR) repeat protein
MKKIILLIYFFCAVAVAQKHTSGYYYNLIWNNGNANKPETFLNYYDKAISLDSSNCAFLYQKRAMFKYNHDDYTGAIEDLTTSLKLNDDCAFEFSSGIEGEAVLSSNTFTHSDTYLRMAYIKYLLKDFTGTIADCNKSIKLDAKNAKAYNQRGLAKEELEDIRGAIVDYSSAIALDKHSIYYNNRASAKDKLSDYRGAIADYSKSIETAPNDDDAYYYRGCAKNSLQDYQGAIADYNKAIKINSNNPYFYASRGLAKIRLKQKNEGCLDLSKAGELGNEYAYELIQKYCN